MSPIIGKNEHGMTAVQACGAGVCALSGALVLGSVLWSTIHNTTDGRQPSFFPIVTLWWMQLLVPFLYIGARWRPLLGDAGFMVAALFLAQTPAWFYKYDKSHILCVFGIFVGAVGYTMVGYQQKRKEANTAIVYRVLCLLGIVPLFGMTVLYSVTTAKNAGGGGGVADEQLWLSFARTTGYCGLQFPFLLIFSPVHNFLGIGTGCSGSLVVMFSWFGLSMSGTAIQIANTNVLTRWLPISVLINGGWLCAAYLILEAIREAFDQTRGSRVIASKEHHRTREVIFRGVSSCLIGFFGIVWSICMIIMLFVWEYDETLPINAVIGGPIFLQLIMHIWFVVGIATRNQTINATFWLNMYLNILWVGSQAVPKALYPTWFWKLMVLRISTVCVMAAEVSIDSLIVGYGSYIREKKFQRFPKFPASAYGILGVGGMTVCLGLGMYVYFDLHHFQAYALAAIVGAGSVRTTMNTSFYGLPFTFFLVYCSNGLMSSAITLSLSYVVAPTAYWVWYISSGAGTTAFLLLAFVKHAMQDVDKYNEETEEENVQDALLGKNQAPASYGGYQQQTQPPYCKV
eukprot:TRINITY_DN67663_c2_g4_i1.p1 TRINITY_DN67663_c2_g4~~TRINITY_DN67663_c2_g4_i1.p1  ORF type:complete len:572 (+),score=21.34 TRINITY_DN67663_c2_g4_i1:59-1774(+)